MQTKSEMEATQDEISVSNYSTEDHEVVSYFLALSEDRRMNAFDVAVKVGVMALKTIGIAERVDYIEKNFEQMETKIRREIEQTFGENGSTPRLIENYFGKNGHIATVLKDRLGKGSDFDKELEDLFGEKGTVARVLENKIGENGELQNILNGIFGENGTIVKELFDPNKEGTPLNRVLVQITREVQDLKTQLGIKEAVATEKERGTAKGKEFEDELDELISPLCSLLGDTLENVSDQPGTVRNSKKGDFICEPSGTSSKIVIEAKDSPYSSKRIQKEMEEAIENRVSGYGIFISKYVEDLDESIGWFNEYKENYIVVALQSKDDDAPNQRLLEIAYKWARIRLTQKEKAKGQETEGLDISNELSNIKNQIDQFKHTRTLCTNIDKAVLDIRRDLDEIQTEIIDNIGAIRRAIKATT